MNLVKTHATAKMSLGRTSYFLASYSEPPVPEISIVSYLCALLEHVVPLGLRATEVIGRLLLRRDNYSPPR